MTTIAHALRHRLRYLRNWELGNVLLLPAVVALMWRTSGDSAAMWHLRALAMVFVSYLLLQGGIYWHLKLQAVLAGRAELPLWFGLVFTALRRTNPWLIGAAALFVVIGRHGAGTEDRAWGVVILAFAYVEHVNYYVRQLMHDTEADMAYLRRFRRLRQAPLRRDLDRVRMG